MMKSMLTRKLLLVAALVSAGLASGAAPAKASGNCDGRISYLTGACTYCSWGTECGGCQISGCTSEPVRPAVDG